MLITYSVSIGTRTFVRVVREEKNVEKHWLRMFLHHLSPITRSWILANLTVPCMLYSLPILSFSICSPPRYGILSSPVLCYCLPVGSHSIHKSCPSAFNERSTEHKAVGACRRFRASDYSKIMKSSLAVSISDTVYVTCRGKDRQ
jgi:hypothetical protein